MAHTTFSPTTLLAGALLLLASTACRSDAPVNAATPASPSPTASSAELLGRIEDERGDARCDIPDECHTIGVGAKACGGPERYVAWSSKDNDGKRLKELVAEHAALRRLQDASSGMMSNCAVVPDPGATCQANKCVLRPLGLGGSQAR